MEVVSIIMWSWIAVSKVLAEVSPFFYTPEDGTWFDAKSFCENSNGRLVTMETQDKYNRIMDEDKQYRNRLSTEEVFIGLYTSTIDCTNYTWTSGNSLAWSKWDLSNAEPNTCFDERCVRIDGGLFRTTNCYRKCTALCERVVFTSLSPISWFDSYRYCRQIGGRLTVITDQANNETVTSENPRSLKTPELPTNWIGLIDMSTNCMQFTWIDASAPGPSFGYCETRYTDMCAGVIFNSSLMYEARQCDRQLCEYGYDEIDHYYLNEKEMTWNGARDLCSQDGGAMATLDTPERYIHSLSLYYNRTNSTSVWIGLYQDSGNCSEYTWSNGNPFGWVKWNKEEPNKCGGQVCGMLTDGGLGTSDCSSLNPVLCVNVTAKIVSTTSSSLTKALKTTAKKPPSHIVTATVKSSKTEMTSAIRITMPVPTTGINTANMPCECCVKNRTNLTHLSHAELQDAIAQLRAQLFVSKVNTSAYLRQRISVYESRPSSMVMGGMACVIITAVIGCIVLPDFIMMCTFLYRHVNRLAHKQDAVMPSI